MGNGLEWIIFGARRNWQLFNNTVPDLSQWENSAEVIHPGEGKDEMRVPGIAAHCAKRSEQTACLPCVFENLLAKLHDHKLSRLHLFTHRPAGGALIT